ncbi:rfaE bifunctional protein, domain I [Pedobacter soli]|uniref:RfaE bifunctional protein, domain I n=2 Tax=Pedobacter soli TaxID=390242 RepID=A0A1G6UEL2_9SPHI|nr:rfaE bifunctional protein, domain I [Pedobacter soli]
MIKVLVIGDIMIDHYIYGKCNRISPEAPVQVVEVGKEEYTLGGAGNVIKNLISFNCEVEIISVIGEDNYGDLILSQLRGLGIGTAGIAKDPNRCTTVKSRVLASNHHLIRLDRENTIKIEQEIEAQLLVSINDRIGYYDIILISDYNKGLLTPSFLEKIFAVCKANGKKTLLDPKGTDFSKYKGVNIIKPNKKEAVLATGIEINNQETLLEACIMLQNITQCDEVVITLSEEGIASFSAGKLNLIQTKALDVIDVTGAGDTVLASIGVSIASNKSLTEACDFANHAAAIVVSKVGSAVASYEEIEEKFPTI